MSARRPAKVCPECHADYQPKRSDQVCCSHSCASARSYRISEARRTAWWKASVETRKPRNLDALKAKLAGCKTLGEAYRLGFAKGYAQGYQTATRRGTRGRAA